ncbi:hypothetical protein KC343_g38 [Hortaea werneckii]|nr:hypothetical protein KC317_g37 [Hortaea werneckii]KAI7638479.1 hypothetical protein KC343_g38 [Hortaea werneckii]
MILSVINVRRKYNGDGPLPMMHYSNIVWNGSTGKAKENRVVQDHSQIYYLGGPMHEILVPDVELDDDTHGEVIAHVMICRWIFCAYCSSSKGSGNPGDERALHRERNTDVLLGLPFVHSNECDIQTVEEAQRNPVASADETGRRPRLMRFRGGSKGYHKYIPEKLFSCLVEYNSGNGIMSVAKVMMCQKMYCQLCSGRAMAEEALERDRNLIEGRGWWSEESDDGDEHVGKKTKFDADFEQQGSNGRRPSRTKMSIDWNWRFMYFLHRDIPCCNDHLPAFISISPPLLRPLSRETLSHMRHRAFVRMVSLCPRSFSKPEVAGFGTFED